MINFDTYNDYSANLVGVPMPDRIKMLPVCQVRKVPVPWFVAVIDGKYEFRVADPEKLYKAVNGKLCWTCGQPLGKYMSFVLGAMCVLNRNNAEPPNHRDCAEFSVRACPFLTRPNMERRDGGLPGKLQEPAGIAIKRNPGCVAIWTTKTYQVHQEPNGLLFTPGEPTIVTWYAEGRAATREEVLESINSGVPILMKMAEEDGEEAVKLLGKMRTDVEKYLPK